MLTADFAGSFGGFGSGNGQFHGAWGIAINDALDNLYIAETVNDRIQVFDSVGNYQFQFGSSGTGNGQFAGAFDVAIGNGGRIHVTDHDNAN